MEEFTYWLKFKDIRNSVNLIDFEDDIIHAVHCVFPNVPVYVTRQEYSFFTNEVTKEQAQSIGNILAKSSLLGKHVKSYKKADVKYSGQLFRRKE